MLSIVGRFRSWALAGLGGAMVIGGSFFTSESAMAATAACITDVELNSAVGDQISSGSFTIDTSKLREAPMCSGLTVAQAIQKIAESASPRAQSRPTPRTDLPLSSPPHSTESAAASTAGKNLPDITSFLTFEDPKECQSTRWADIFYAAIDRKPFRLGTAGQIGFRRSGPDKDGYLSDSADINALWNGLTITRLEFEHLPDTDSTAKTLVFKESAETVKAVLSRKGIPTGRIGEMIEVGDEMTFAITLSRRGTGASFACGT